VTKRVGAQTEWAVSTLVTEAPVVLIDFSRSGCLLECTRPVEPGTVGSVQLEVDGEWCVEEIRITRCVQVSGRGSTWRLGAEFLPTRQSGGASLRHAVERVIARSVAPSSPAERRYAPQDRNGNGQERSV
jgi:hypothetical protein